MPNYLWVSHERPRRGNLHIEHTGERLHFFCVNLQWCLCLFPHCSIMWSWTTVPLFIESDGTMLHLKKSFNCHHLGSCWLIRASGFTAILQILWLHIQNLSQFRSECQKMGFIGIGGVMQHNVFKFLDENSVICHVLFFCVVFFVVVCAAEDQVVHITFTYLSALSEDISTHTHTHTQIHTYTHTHTRTDKPSDALIWKKSYSCNICNKFIMYFYILFCTWK